MKLKKVNKPTKPTHSLMDALLNLSGSEIKTYLFLKENANESGEVEVLMRGFGKKLNLSNVTIRRCVMSLEEKGWLNILRNSAKAGRDSIGKTTFIVEVL